MLDYSAFIYCRVQIATIQVYYSKIIKLKHWYFIISTYSIIKVLLILIDSLAGVHKFSELSFLLFSSAISLVFQSLTFVCILLSISFLCLSTNEAIMLTFSCFERWIEII